MNESITSSSGDRQHHHALEHRCVALERHCVKLPLPKAGPKPRMHRQLRKRSQLQRPRQSSHFFFAQERARESCGRTQAATSGSAMPFKKAVTANHETALQTLEQACQDAGIDESRRMLAALADSAVDDECLCTALLTALEAKGPADLHSEFCCRVAEGCGKRRNVPGMVKREFDLYATASRRNNASAKPLVGMGNISMRTGQCMSAIVQFEKAAGLAVAAKDAVMIELAFGGWSKALAQLGDIEEALCTMEAGAQETGAILPAFKGVPPFRNPFWASAYLMLLNYSAKRARDDISRMHLSYGEWLRGRVGPSARPLARDRNRSRKLRIGYLSGDLWDHVVADSVEGVLLGHNKDNVHVTCYQLQATTDAKTLRLKALSDRWVMVAGLSAADIVEQIRNDEIDICVELGGHTESCRLDVMARRPAPIGVSWMGYPNTTGLDCIDYRITDGVCDHRESTQIYSEKLVRLPTFFHCLAKQEILTVPVGEAPPCVAKGTITFGTFNNVQKHSEKAKACWGKVLLALPASQLLVKAKIFHSPADKKHWEDTFIETAMRGAGGTNFKTAAKLRNQLNLIPTTTISSYREHIEMYNNMDVMLDSWPYGGTTTTTEAVLMGVPVVTMATSGAGSCHSQNVGASILNQIGLRDLVAYSEDEFVRICVSLANSPERLQHIKTTLRETCLASISKPVADGLCQEVEEAYRQMWLSHLDETA